MADPRVRIPLVDLKSQYRGLADDIGKAMTQVLDAGVGSAQGRVVQPVRVPPAPIHGTLEDLADEPQA